MHSQTIKDLEQNMVSVITALEQRGLDVDLVELENLITKTQSQKADLDRALCEALGLPQGQANFNSAQDVSEILASKLGVRITRTKSGRPSTSKSVLQNICNPITDQISQYRQLEDLLSSLKAIHQATNKDTGKISCSYDTSCPSGRLYTKFYSLQSIPEPARDCIFADPGSSFILADFDSFELRILSALAGDTYFKSCWAEGLDLHKKVISDMKQKPYHLVTDKERKLGKTLSFGLSYGQEPVGLAMKLRISVPEAEKLMADC